MGDKAGQKAFPPGTALPPSQAPIGMGLPPMGVNQQSAIGANHGMATQGINAQGMNAQGMIAQQNNALDVLERRRERERGRERSGSMSAVQSSYFLKSYANLCSKATARTTPSG